MSSNEIVVLGPTMKRGKSVQAVATPWEFIFAVEEKFGEITWDLAATADNAKAPYFITPEMDTFTVNWAKLLDGKLGWLNPEFDPMEKWVSKCALEQNRGAEFVVIGPASVSTNWFWNYVKPFSTVYCLTPRIAFVGSHEVFPPRHLKAGQRKCDESCVGCCPYPKDLMLMHYCANPNHELQRWRWK